VGDEVSARRLARQRSASASTTARLADAILTASRGWVEATPARPPGGSPRSAIRRPRRHRVRRRTRTHEVGALGLAAIDCCRPLIDRLVSRALAASIAARSTSGRWPKSRSPRCRVRCSRSGAPPSSGRGALRGAVADAPRAHLAQRRLGLGRHSATRIPLGGRVPPRVQARRRPRPSRLRRDDRSASGAPRHRSASTAGASTCGRRGLTTLRGNNGSSTAACELHDAPGDWATDRNVGRRSACAAFCAAARARCSPASSGATAVLTTPARRRSILRHQ